MYEELTPGALSFKKGYWNDRDHFSFVNENLDKQTTRELRKEARLMAAKIFNEDDEEVKVEKLSNGKYNNPFETELNHMKTERKLLTDEEREENDLVGPMDLFKKF